MYDVIAGKQLLHSSYFVGQKKALELFPTLKRKDLCGGIVYYDGKRFYEIRYLKNICRCDENVRVLQ